MIISVTSFYFSQRMRNNFLLFVVSFFFSLYILEFFLIKYNKFIYKKTNSNFLKQIESKNFDQRTKIEIYKDLLTKNKNISLYVSPAKHLNDNNLKILPLSGKSKSTTILCNESGFYSIYLSDRYGFNNPDSQWEKKEIDYLLTGDSFVHGACVNRPDDIASILRGDNEKSFITKNNVINLGQSATGPVIQYASLREYLGSKKVKNILWFYFENDINQDIFNEINIPILKKYFNDEKFTQNLKEKQILIDNIIEKKITFSKKRIKYNWKLFLKLSSVRSLIQIREKEVTKEILNKFYNIISLSNDLAKKNNSNFYFIYLPSYKLYVEPDNSINAQYRNKIIRKIRSLNITVIDMHENVFSKNNDVLSLFPFRRNGHYNELGYKLVAENIYKSINK